MVQWLALSPVESQGAFLCVLPMSVWVVSGTLASYHKCMSKDSPLQPIKGEVVEDRWTCRWMFM